MLICVGWLILFFRFCAYTGAWLGFWSFGTTWFWFVGGVLLLLCGVALERPSGREYRYRGNPD